MFNAEGKTALIVERNTIDSESTAKLDISNLLQGFYFLTIKSNGIITGSQKVVITK